MTPVVETFKTEVIGTGAFSWIQKIFFSHKPYRNGQLLLLPGRL